MVIIYVKLLRAICACVYSDPSMTLEKDKQKKNCPRYSHYPTVYNNATAVHLQMSYTAAASILNNRKKFRNFFNTLPSLDLVANALAGIISYFGWRQAVIISQRKDQYNQASVNSIMNNLSVKAQKYI